MKLQVYFMENGGYLHFVLPSVQRKADGEVLEQEEKGCHNRGPKLLETLCFSVNRERPTNLWVDLENSLSTEIS